jgi:hypothetical protein
MHLRISRVRRNGKTYEYAQLVESYRRKQDGMPALRVVLNLGQLSSAEIANWRIALDAMREGKALVIAEPLAGQRPVKPRANLRYLDLAVLLELWNSWGLTKLLDELMPVGDALVPPSLITAALTLQRCVEPTPKAYAPEWFAKTALPELLGIPPAQYNNTRLHRVLDELDGVSQQLGWRLPRLYAEREGRFVAMFADVTDTWFVGHGPEMAEKAPTKEGRFERKINIVLLCNEHGYPLRWKVFPGRQHDSKAMLELYGSLRGLSWVGNTPVVCDRAMGNTAHLRGLLETGVYFLTALVRTEFGSYVKNVPFESLLSFEPTPGEEPAEADIAEARRLIESTQMVKVDDDLFVLDCMIVLRDEVEQEEEEENGEGEAKSQDDPAIDKTVKAMVLGRRLKEDLEQGRAASYQTAGAHYRLDKGLVGRYLSLLKLPADVQEAILQGKAVGLSVKSLAAVAKIDDAEQQRTTFAQLVEQVAQRPDGRRTRTATKQTSKPKEEEKPLRVRAVLYFNPEIFVAQRWAASQSLAAVRGFVAELNKSLADSPSGPEQRESTGIIGKVYAVLRKHGLLRVYKFAVVNQEAAGGQTCRQVELTFNQQVWDRRRRYDGFSVLVGHPEIEGSGVELAKLYRSKETIEHDFHVIKSLVDIRPLHHRTEPKIRGHVTLCMLGLLLERTMKRKLEAVRSGFSSVGALRALESCCLNMYEAQPGMPTGYCITQPDEAQAAILRALRLKHLTDDREMADRMTPR